MSQPPDFPRGDADPAARPPTDPLHVLPLDGEAEGLLVEHGRMLRDVQRSHVELARLMQAAAVGDRIETLSRRSEALHEEQQRIGRGVDGMRRRLGLWFAVAIVLFVLGAGGVAWTLWHELGPGPEPRADPAMVVAEPLRLPVAPIEPQAEPARDDGEVARLQSKFDEVRRQRNDQIAEVSRLRQELMTRDLRIEELVGSMGEISASLDAPTEPTATISRTDERDPPPLASAVQQALRASGERDLRIVEVGGIEDGALTGLLAMRVDRRGVPSAAFTVPRAWLVVEDSRVSLRLALTEGDDPEVEDVFLPTVAREIWNSMGVVVPRDFVPVDDVNAALSSLLFEQPYEILSLGGWDGFRMTGLVLRHVDSLGIELAIYRADFARLLPSGPTLLMEDGTVEQNGVDRPFWRGVARLPLPGASYAAWAAAMGLP